MTIKQIEYFLKICELVQINRCAKELKISQSALSIAIKNLEISLGGALFDRRSKSLILNERGKAFKDAIIPLYENLLEIKRDMQNLNMYKISIGCSQNIGTYLLPDLFNELLNSKQKFDLNIQNSACILDLVLNNRCDLGIVENKIFSDDVKKIKICDDELIVVSGDKNFKNKSFYIDEIATYPWINREFGSGVRECLYENIPNEVTLNSILNLNSSEAIKELIKNKTYFACLPKFILKNELNKGIYEINLKNVSFKRELTIIYKNDKTISETFIKIVNNLKNKIEQIHSKKS